MTLQIFSRARKDFLSCWERVMINSEGLADLARRAQAGDRPAQMELVERIGPDLEHFARRHGDLSTGVESISDLTQQAALRFWEKFHQFRGADSDEATAAMLYEWIQQLVQNLAANRREALRTAKRCPDLPVLRLGQHAHAESQQSSTGLDPPATGPSPSEAARTAELDARVRLALNNVPNGCMDRNGAKDAWMF
jgi:DNA-directed RNA polymerase specialized sigma24 family protein